MQVYSFVASLGGPARTAAQVQKRPRKRAICGAAENGEKDESRVRITSRFVSVCLLGVRRRTCDIILYRRYEAAAVGDDDHDHDDGDDGDDGGDGDGDLATSAARPRVKVARRRGKRRRRRRVLCAPPGAIVRPHGRPKLCSAANGPINNRALPKHKYSQSALVHRSTSSSARVRFSISRLRVVFAAAALVAACRRVVPSPASGPRVSSRKSRQSSFSPVRTPSVFYGVRPPPQLQSSRGRLYHHKQSSSPAGSRTKR